MADLASVRLPLLFSASVLLLIFSSFSGAAQGHATSFSPCFGSPLVSVHAPDSGPAARQGIHPPLIFSLGPYAHPLLALDSVPHAEASGHSSVGFLCVVKTRQGDSFDRICL
jgi:hypothetical protein